MGQKLIDKVVNMLLENDPSKYLLQMTKTAYDELISDYENEFGDDLEELGQSVTKHSLEEYLNIKILIAKDATGTPVRLIEKR